MSENKNKTLMYYKQIWKNKIIDWIIQEKLINEDNKDSVVNVKCINCNHENLILVEQFTKNKIINLKNPELRKIRRLEKLEEERLENIRKANDELPYHLWR
jgi:ssDNA-binding Zn-finger/Zn-ribbon topoisomerase 1